jgi:peptidoglycan hydrolase-like protein with peptidoglycan-binding domain
MRRIVLSCAVLAAAASFTAPAAAYNPQVAGLQAALRAHGLYGGPIDGIQGKGTRTALRRFQTHAGLEADGIAGPRTRSALGRLGRPLFGARTIRRGNRGWDVSVLQFLLQRHGFTPGRIDGHFGTATKKAVRRYQRFAHLVPDGIVGKTTAAVLCSVRACKFARFRHAPRTPLRIHHVKPGETLTAIAARYGVGMRTLARANRLDPRRVLLAGARLRIPHTLARTGGTTIVQPESVRYWIDHWSRHYGVDSTLVRALAWMESGYNNNLTSSYGARGIMQVTDATWRYAETVLIGARVSHDSPGNIRVGVAFLAHLLRSFGGNERLALAAYAQGPLSVRKRGLLPETRLYVRNVLALKKRAYTSR